MIYYYDGQLEKALECYKKSAELIPNLPKGYEFMGYIYADRKRKEYKQALEYMNKAIAYGANAKNDIYFAEYQPKLYYRLGMYQKALDKIKRFYTYGEKFKNNESLQNSYKVISKKLDSIQASKK